MEDRKEFLKKIEEVNFLIKQEPLEKCFQYQELLYKWQKKVNLIGPSTIEYILTRHVLDGIQLLPFVPRGTILDVGSGAGIPGIILAIFLDQKITLCERITKKTSFLKEATRKLNLSDHCIVLNKDIRELKEKFDVITARAVTSLSNFFDLVEYNIKEETLFILPKGKEYLSEINIAKKYWNFELVVHSSILESGSKILLFKKVSRKL